VLNRWELPGPPRVFSVDDAGMTVKVDLGAPRTGELMTLHFAGDRFTGRPLPHVGLIGRIRRMKAGWGIAKNFNRESGRAGLLLPISHFRYSPIDADPTLPSTLPDLKAALENAIARDPTQPWYPMFLALTTWELGDRAAANRIIDDLFAKPYASTPYYEYSWMARMFEPYGHRDWADRAYAEALKRRRAEAQPIVMTATIERMLDAPFIRRAAYNSIVSPDPPRDHKRRSDRDSPSAPRGNWFFRRAPHTRRELFRPAADREAGRQSLCSDLGYNNGRDSAPQSGNGETRQSQGVSRPADSLSIVEGILRA